MAVHFVPEGHATCPAGHPAKAPGIAVLTTDYTDFTDSLCGKTFRANQSERRPHRVWRLTTYLVSPRGAR